MGLQLSRCAALLLAAIATGSVAAPPAPQANIAQGTLAGVREGRIDAFLDIPYAAPPTGANRWRAPQPPTSWAGVRPADHFGPSCYQAVMPNGFGPWTHEYVVHGAVSEDCLSLNVWTPDLHSGKKLPVLVWIHGGGFSQGSGSVPIYDGRHLASKGIVVVTINYRLGVFGFLALPALTAQADRAPPANFGLQDQIAALRWVRGNISKFGGDPDMVTIAGQSAGSMSVHLLVASPLAKGLFERAIAESGLPSVAPPPSLAQAEASGTAFAKEVGAHSLAELRAMTPEQLSPKGASPLRFFPVVDGRLVIAPPRQLLAEGRFNDVPMIVGQNADEGSALSRGYGAGDAASFDALLHSSFGAMANRFRRLYPASTDAQRSTESKQILLDKGLGSIWMWAHARGGNHAPVYAYLFTHPEPGPHSARYGVFHSSEIPYVFGTLNAAPERGFDATDRRISQTMSTYWVNFVRTGNPNAAGLPAWPQLTATQPRILKIGDQAKPAPLLSPAKLDAVKAFIASGGSLSPF